MTRRRWGDEPTEVMGDAEPAGDEPARDERAEDEPARDERAEDEPAKDERAPDESAEGEQDASALRAHPDRESLRRQRRNAPRGLAVATVVLAVAALLRIALSLWDLARNAPGAGGRPPGLAGWQWTVIFAGLRASDIQVLLVVTLLAAVATVGATWLHGHDNPLTRAQRAAAWGQAAVTSACAAVAATVVLVFYLMVLVLSRGPRVRSLLDTLGLPLTLAQVALIALACAAAGGLLTRYAARQRHVAADPPTSG